MAGTPFLGVELPDKFETNSSESAPEISEPSSGTDKAPEGNQDSPDKPETEVDKPDTATVAAKPDFLDLDKHERVRFQGKEWSLKDLQNSLLRHEDYTRKVQATKEESKYATHFDADLESLLDGQVSLADFKKVYPARYVQRAERILEKYSGKGTAEAKAETPETFTSRPALDPDTQAKLDQLIEFQQSVEQRVMEAKTAQDAATIDGWFQEYTKKYPEADEKLVTFEAGELMRLREESTGKPVDKKAAQEILEKVFKSDHDARLKRQVEKSRAQINSQKAAQKRGQDMGSGGGVPTAPSNKPRSMKEARERLEADADAGRLS